DARPVVPRRQEAPALRLRRDRARVRRGAASPAGPQASRSRPPNEPELTRCRPSGATSSTPMARSDVHSVMEAGREITDDPAALSVTWRQKQLEYSWLRSLMGRYEDFWSVTGAAL